MDVPHLIYSSVGGAERHTGIPHFESKRAVEQYLHQIGVPTTVLRPTFFMDNFSGAFAPRAEDGELVLRAPLQPDVPLQMIAVTDIGQAAATALLDPQAVPGGAVELDGDELTAQQIAEALRPFPRAARPVRSAPPSRSRQRRRRGHVRLVHPPARLRRRLRRHPRPGRTGHRLSRVRVPALRQRDWRDTGMRQPPPGFDPRQVDVTGTQLSVTVGGRVDPLLLLHGWPQTSNAWRRVVGPLAAHGYQVIVPDLRGLGASERATDGYAKTTKPKICANCSRASA